MIENTSILVISHDVEASREIESVLGENGSRLEIARSGREGVQRAEGKAHDLVFLSLDLPDIDGLAVLERIRQVNPTVPVVVIAGPQATDQVADAIRAGAYNWIPKPVEKDRLKSTAESALSKRGMLVGAPSLEGGLREEPGLKKIIGSSEEIQDVFKSIETVLQADVPVLIQGETGTGKELVAKAIHWRGPRRRFAFAPVNCAAIPENLLESELFGHEKGAFTGATDMRKGRFEIADKGTIFLDEIGEMSPQLQVKFLRVLEDGCFQRVGGNKIIHVDVRVISATNKNLSEEVEAGRFRQDLYYRLAVFPIHLPSLRDRVKDIPELAYYFLERYGKLKDKRIDTIAPETIELLCRYDWPGNVRQLQNCIRRAVLVASDNVLRPENVDLPISQGSANADASELQNDVSSLMIRLQQNEIVPLQEVEAILIQQALNVTGGNITDAAEKLGISRSTIYRKLQEHGIQA